ncbi:fam-a protein [Plasmodium vinckei petteri]|uniref:Fam-a protein n=1 Tax=Plasmodium vinckei petteri TaxID=138298 RepID=A0A6V7TEM3_PLAVN|nr:fam-a protein [Plasmodium vinckei petteri]
MKVISVGLISLIVFNIVLAKNSSDSGSTTDCSSLLEEKTKKTHKTTEKSVNVKGKGPYEKGYEENYRDMVKDIFMPLEDDYQYSRNNSHKQDDAPPPVSKGPKKQKFTEKRQLRTINENKEIYQKPKDLLCTDPEKDTKTKEKTKSTTELKTESTTELKTESTTEPKTKSTTELKTESTTELKTESTTEPKTKSTTELKTESTTELKTESTTELKTESTTESKTKSKKHCDTSEEIYEKNKDLLCTNRNETINAAKLMNEAATHLERHIKSSDGYEVCKRFSFYDRSLSIKKHGDTVVQKMNYKYYHPNNYNEIINLLWDPALANNFNPGSVKRKIVRVYNPNLVIIQQRYKNGFRDSWKYFSALAAKFDISKEKTIIVMASANINDHNSKNKDSYKNTIIENANLFTTDINSENDIRKGKLEKTFVNIAGYLIEHRDWYIDITYLESIDGYTSNYQELIIDKALNKIF